MDGPERLEMAHGKSGNAQNGLQEVGNDQTGPQDAQNHPEWIHCRKAGGIQIGPRDVQNRPVWITGRPGALRIGHRIGRIAQNGVITER